MGKGKLVVKTKKVMGGYLEPEARLAKNSEALESAEWRKVYKNTLILDPEDRALQYRLVFHSKYGDIYPTVDSVELNLKP